MLNQKFNQAAPKSSGPRQSGQTVTIPRQLAAIAIKNSRAATTQLSPSPLAQTLASKKKAAKSK